MSFLEIMQAYFRGEKLESMFFIFPIGIALIAFGFVALKAERGGFAWGIAVPVVLCGLILGIVGATVAFRTSGQVVEITKGFHEAPATMLKSEIPRMQKVMANFRITFYSFGAVAAIGLALHYLVHADWARGLGSALILISAIGLLIDGFAERRAEPYVSALTSLSHTVGAADH